MPDISSKPARLARPNRRFSKANASCSFSRVFRERTKSLNRGFFKHRYHRGATDYPHQGLADLFRPVEVGARQVGPGELAQPLHIVLLPDWRQAGVGKTTRVAGQEVRLGLSEFFDIHTAAHPVIIIARTALNYIKL